MKDTRWEHAADNRANKAKWHRQDMNVKDDSSKSMNRGHSLVMLIATTCRDAACSHEALVHPKWRGLRE